MPADDSEPAAGGATPPAGAPGDDLRGRMRTAVGAVRREGLKVALLYAGLDAAAAAAVANVAARVAAGDVVPAELPVPAAVATRVGATSVRTATVATVLAFALVLVGEFALRVRQPLVERFEAVNPPVHEALRTARDALEDPQDTRMARRLYADVLARLRETSTAGLVDWRRVAVTVVVVLAASVGGVQVAVSDVSLPPLDDRSGGDGAAGPGGGAGGGGGGGASDPADGLRDGSEILGDPEDVQAGEDPLNATVDTQPGPGDDRPSPPESYDQSGFGGGGSVEGQQAGFADEEPPADAELIRRYTLAVRGEDDE